MDRVFDSFFSPATPQSPLTPFTPETKHGSFSSSGSDVVQPSPEIPELIAQHSPELPPKDAIIHCDPANLHSPNRVNVVPSALPDQRAENPPLSDNTGAAAAAASASPAAAQEDKSVPDLQAEIGERTCLSSFAGLSTSKSANAGVRDDDDADSYLNLSATASPLQKSNTTLPGNAEDRDDNEASQQGSSGAAETVFFYDAKPRLNQFVGLIRYLLERGHHHTTSDALIPETAADVARHDQFICYANVEALTEAATQVLKKEPNMLELNVPEDDTLVVVGDIHGQFVDMYCSVLTQQVSEEHNPGQIDKHFLFLGDLVDRGPFSVEVCMLVLALKVEFPDMVYITRGNHEESKTSRVYGFLTESQAKFGEKGTWAWDKMNQTFRHIPLCAIVKTPKMRFFATHGGITPALHDDVSTIAKVDRAAYCYTLKGEQEDLVNGLLWSDPTVDVGTYTRNPRGCGVQFGRLATDTFCTHNNVDFICRAHQVVMDGYCWQHRDKIVTVFSAPNYCGINDNLGAIMIVTGTAKRPTFVQYEAFELDEEAAPAPDGNFAYASCFQ